MAPLGRGGVARRPSLGAAQHFPSDSVARPPAIEGAEVLSLGASLAVRPRVCGYTLAAWMCGDTVACLKLEEFRGDEEPCP